MKRDGLQQIAIAGLLVSVAVLAPWFVLYPAALWLDALVARWALAQWRPLTERAPVLAQPKEGPVICDA